MKARICRSNSADSQNQLTYIQQKAADKEIKRLLIEQYESSLHDLDAVILYTLHTRFGFGKKRLMQFWEAFGEEYDKLRHHYEMPEDGPWLCRQQLMKIGVDVDKWNKLRDEGKSVFEP